LAFAAHAQAHVMTIHEKVLLTKNMAVL